MNTVIKNMWRMIEQETEIKPTQVKISYLLVEEYKEYKPISSVNKFMN